jgi:hypothetical protein
MQHPQMPPASLAQAARAGRAGPGATWVCAAGAVHGRDRPGGLPDRVGECFEIVSGRPGRLGGVEADHFPAQWSGEASRVPGAQVVAVRLGVGRQWPEYSGRLRVDIGERRHGGLAASGARAATKAHEREG